MPPTDPEQLVSEVYDRLTGSRQRETAVAADDSGGVAVPDIAGGEVAARRVEALTLLREIRPRREMHPVTGGPWSR